jgi:hypothetical protein
LPQPNRLQRTPKTLLRLLLVVLLLGCWGAALREVLYAAAAAGVVVELLSVVQLLAAVPAEKPQRAGHAIGAL